METSTAEDSSFSARRLNSSTFVLEESDVYGEKPLIYVKVHKKVPVIIVTDTGCDQPVPKLKKGGAKPYIIICTHCHYDHILGITQFLEGGTTEIIASAAGRDFIESDLETHGQFKGIAGKPAPRYKVTHWAQAFERFQYAPKSKDGMSSASVDLEITFIQVPGHTPDSLAWYDHEEMHLYVGDSLYETTAIVWPGEGNLVEWEFSMQKLAYFAKSENARAAALAEKSDHDGWINVARRVKLAAGHSSFATDAEELLQEVDDFWWQVLSGKIPVVAKFPCLEEECWVWKDKHGKHSSGMVYFQAPIRLMEDARRFFKDTGPYLCQGTTAS